MAVAFNRLGIHPHFVEATMNYRKPCVFAEDVYGKSAVSNKVRLICQLLCPLSR